MLFTDIEKTAAWCTQLPFTMQCSLLRHNADLSLLQFCVATILPPLPWFVWFYTQLFTRLWSLSCILVLHFGAERYNGSVHTNRRAREIKIPHSCTTFASFPLKLLCTTDEPVIVTFFVKFYFCDT